MTDPFKAAALLVGSNVFMTTAWYAHLRIKSLPMWKAIAVSWGIAFFEYCLMIPANRIGYRTLSAFQLKIMQEAITLTVFVGFAILVLGEPLMGKYVASFALIMAAVAIAFW
jgi:uncharacterized protein (DUF486 family)